MKHVIFYGILLSVISAGFSSCEKETYNSENSSSQYAKEEGEEDEFADYIRGTVSNTSNVALDNATVTLYFQNNVYASTTTATDGLYDFIRVPVGQYLLKVQKTGYINQSITIQANNNGQIVNDFLMIAE